MKVLLIDVDSKIPNLALMKLSTHHKALGDEVGFRISNPDLIYVSIIFTRHRYMADAVRYMYPGVEIHVGGTGCSASSKLPCSDCSMPDYGLYPSSDYSIGFTTRGCIRRCCWCVVPEKEGDIRISQHPREFHNPIYNKIMLLDNNVLALKNWFFEITDWIIDNDLQVDFSQGLDIRLVDTEIAERLKELKHWKTWKFAFDSKEYEDAVVSGIETLKAAGIDVKSDTMFYVYLNDDRDFDDAAYRCSVLKENGSCSYLMINQNSLRTPRMTALKRWCRPWIYWSIEFCDYKHKTLPDCQTTLEELHLLDESFQKAEGEKNER